MSSPAPKSSSLKKKPVEETVQSPPAQSSSSPKKRSTSTEKSKKRSQRKRAPQPVPAEAPKAESSAKLVSSSSSEEPVSTPPPTVVLANGPKLYVNRSVSPRISFGKTMGISHIDDALKVRHGAMITVDGIDKKNGRLDRFVLVRPFTDASLGKEGLPNDLDARPFAGGVVVDTKAGMIVSLSAVGHSCHVVSDTLPTGKVSTVEMLRESIGNETRYQPEVEGIPLDLGWYGGRLQLRSRSSLDVSNSSFSGSDTFWNLFHAAMPFDPSGLFDTSKYVSPYQYSFILMDPKFVFGGQRVVNSPTLVFLGRTKIWNSDSGVSYSRGIIDDVDRSTLFESFIVDFPVMSPEVGLRGKGVYVLKNLSPADAQGLLSAGFPLFSYKKSSGRRFTDPIKIRPTSYVQGRSMFSNGNLSTSSFSRVKDLWIPVEDFITKYKNYRYPLPAFSSHLGPVDYDFSSDPWDPETNAFAMVEDSSSYRMRIIAMAIAELAPIGLRDKAFESAIVWRSLVEGARDWLYLRRGCFFREVRTHTPKASIPILDTEYFHLYGDKKNEGKLRKFLENFATRAGCLGILSQEEFNLRFHNFCQSLSEESIPTFSSCCNIIRKNREGEGKSEALRTKLRALGLELSTSPPRPQGEVPIGASSEGGDSLESSSSAEGPVAPEISGDSFPSLPLRQDAAASKSVPLKNPSWADDDPAATEE